MRLALVLAAWADFATFAFVVSIYGIHGEFNGVAVWAYQEAGLLGVAILKTGITLLFLAERVPTRIRLLGVVIWTFGSIVNFISGALILG